MVGLLAVGCGGEEPARVTLQSYAGTWSAPGTLAPMNSSTGISIRREITGHVAGSTVELSGLCDVDPITLEGYPEHMFWIGSVEPCISIQTNDCELTIFRLTGVQTDVLEDGTIKLTAGGTITGCGWRDVSALVYLRLLPEHNK